MRAAPKCYSYGWNVFKRITNNRFSSSTMLFLTNMQQLKALISSEDCSNGSAFRVRHSSRHISVNRMLWPEPQPIKHSFFFFPLASADMVFSLFFYSVNVSLLHANITPAYMSAYAFSHTHSAEIIRGRCYFCSHRRTRRADTAERSQRVSKVITTATASGRPGKEAGID